MVVVVAHEVGASAAVELAVSVAELAAAVVRAAAACGVDGRAASSHVALVGSCSTAAARVVVHVVVAT